MNDDDRDESWPDVWRRVIVGADEQSWVVFENGTCVILMEPVEDLRAQAIAILSEYGPVHPGSTSGDFSVIPLEDESGWVVTGHHPDILNFVEKLVEPPNDAVIGLLGRQYRANDAESLNVIHVEDHRP